MKGCDALVKDVLVQHMNSRDVHTHWSVMKLAVVIHTQKFFWIVLEQASRLLTMAIRKDSAYFYKFTAKNVKCSSS